ncbi:DinB family protein [Alcanivorax hongdengensis A-11-3]|uniref:DinB family protein n=1 Tax=Alcanivorax hongdengensis A-11-3 TaxID=1177179 RepID=L0WAI3_9GAMM|nr:DinB family protein [Alcanivorax hongdengensis]EKF73778.1 DinB family protein [Alcanivorax hongdengensis A-11-3]
MSVSLFREMARYNQWQNRQLYRACGSLDDAHRKRDCGLFFHSIHGTLNHLLLTDRLWMARFTGDSFTVTGLDQQLYEQFDELCEQRQHTDRQIVDFFDQRIDEDLQGILSYQSAATGEWRSFPQALCFNHFFNHQTHHRGQITAALSAQGIDFGVTDLIFMPRQ